MKRSIVVMTTAAALGAIGVSPAIAVPSPGTPTYSPFPYSSAASGSSTLLTGIRSTGSADATQVYMSGVYKPTSGGTQGLLYTGALAGGGSWTVLNCPSSTCGSTTSTALYGPDNIGTTGVRVVGSYKTSATGQLDHGVILNAPSGLGGTVNWTTLDATSLVTSGAGHWTAPTLTRSLSLGSTGAAVTAVQKALIARGFPISSISSGASGFGTFDKATQRALSNYLASSPRFAGSAPIVSARIYSALTTDSLKNTIAHSTRGGLVVGNFDTTLIAGRAFITNVTGTRWYAITKPGAVSITAYGIWYNSPNSYTIAGGYFAPPVGSAKPVEHAYLVDYNSSTNVLSGWRSYDFANSSTTNVITHFDGITTDGSGGYYLTGDRLGVGSLAKGEGFFAHVIRTSGGALPSTATWQSVKYPGAAVTSGNSVYLKNVIGIYAGPGSSAAKPYLAAF